jgi:hypothetical protein
VAANDPDDLSRVMAAAITEPHWRERTMPKPETVRAVFSSSVMAADVLKLYREALGFSSDR